eukprot:INCI13418.4.p1 GENE.INCI13418.4~~INCI13418.4.p1  ORF type:complete len:731 (-),score=85.37 INCI13418.4:161-2284(-)
MANNDNASDALAAADSDVSDGDEPQDGYSEEQLMLQLLPRALTYESRKEATTAIRRAVVQATGHGVRIDPKRSSARRVTYVCVNVGPAQARVDSGCPFEAVAVRKVAGRKRRGSHCGGGAVQGDGAGAQNFYWEFKTYDGTGLNYVPHAEDCTARARVTNDVVETMLYEAVTANPAISRRSMVSHLTARLTTLSAADIPSTTSIYRARRAIKDSNDRFYNDYWARIESYLADFETLNPESHVKLEKDPQNHFKRYFVGVKASVKMLQHCGVDFFGIDACFTKHHIVSGMQLHLLCGRTGANTNIIIAWSLELSESNDTYRWFAAQCEEAGFGDLTRVAPGRLNRNPVCFADGFKGTGHFSAAFPRLHHALCAVHLSKAIRASLRRLRSAGQQVEVGFADAQIIAVCSSTTDADYRSNLDKLSTTSRSAAARLVSYDAEKWSCNAMAKKGIPAFGHCTSNVVEGTNGVLEPARRRHPYEFLDTIVRYVSERIATHDAMFQKLHSDGKLLTEYASAMYKESRNLARKRAYKMQRQASGTYVVWDDTSRHKIRHIVCIDPEKPNCTQCRQWGNYRAMCAHMMLVVANQRRELFEAANRRELVRTYFHPAFLVENCIQAVGQHLEAPKAHFGPLGNSVGDIVPMDSDGEEVDSTPAIPQNPMLPPVKYTLDQYKLNGRRARPRTRRYHSTAVFPRRRRMVRPPLLGLASAS